MVNTLPYAPLAVDSSFSMELVGKRALWMLRENLNDELDAQQAKWMQLDGQLDLPLTSVEHFMVENFYHGHRPSLIEAPVDRYPNCSVMAWQATPQFSDFDQVDLFQLHMYVELMCKSDDDEGEVNSRIQRSVDATHAVVMADRTLGGIISDISNTPSVLLTDVFVRSESREVSRRFIWQGARMEYTIVKPTAL
jgi:hypothetical protein